MSSKETEKPGLIQHKVRPAVKQWIESKAKSLDRSQAWFVNKLVEDAYEADKAEGLQKQA